MAIEGLRERRKPNYVVIAAILPVTRGHIAMPETCSVKDCKNRGRKGGRISYHRFPAIILDQGERTRELSTRRRLAWIASLRRKNWNPTEYSRVCSAHFISGSNNI